MKQLAAAVYAKARVDLIAFAMAVGRDERTGKHIDPQPFHRIILRALQYEAMVAIFAGPETGKSYCTALALAWWMGLDLTLRCAIVSAYQMVSERLLRLVVGVMNSPDYQLVFPEVKIERVTSDELFLFGRPLGAKDPNLRAASFGTSSTLSARVDRVVNDEITTRESLHSQQHRDRAQLDYSANILTRLAPDARMVIANTREHYDDLPSRLIQQPGWKVLNFPLIDETGASLWPERWPLDRISKRRAEIGERRFMTTCLCQPAPEGQAIFAEQDIERAFANGVSVQYNDVPDGKVILACDPAWTTKSTSDLSALVLIVVEPGGYLHLTHVETWRISAEALINRIVALARQARASVGVEANAAGTIIAESVARRGVPCKAYPTTRASKELAVESLSSQLAAGKWCFRQPLGSPGPELLALRSDLLTFSWDSGAHTGDRLSAVLCGQAMIHEIMNRPRGGFLDAHRSDGGRWTFQKITR